ncbi:MAG TPA: CDP-alcohol phosphatidyltransferase family protein, partial [Gemmatimonadaceae bacterium]|nr:CDP-alcohol phosphatidyltransferase family protein [Gemmatimonadaceae bacterium]
GAIFSLPNVVSMSRVVLAAGFVGARGAEERLALIGVASVTDFLDGWLARRRNAATRWGALIDPIADRIFVLTAVSAFLLSGELTTWQYFVLLSRDIMTAVGFLVARLVPWLRPVEFKARYLGKVVTTLQLATFIAILAYPDLVTFLVLLVGVASAAAIVDYTYALWRARAR